MKRHSIPALGLVLLLLVTAFAPISAAQDPESVEITVEPVRDGVYVLMGRGGNIGLSTGEDGAFLIDDQFAPLTEAIQAAIATVTDDPVRFVVNTHWHGDHTGGNENFGQAGALIVAHENVRRRMNPAEFSDLMGSSEQAPPAALPVVTFTDAVTFHWNDSTIRTRHVGPGHTDGDSIIWFEEANVVHMGDNLFVGSYPFIDVDSGGDVDGMIAVAERVLADADDQTRIIPGHGPVSGRADLVAFRDMLRTIRDRVQALIDQGLDLEQILAEAPTADHDEGMQTGFMNPERFVTLIYRSLTE